MYCKVKQIENKMNMHLNDWSWCLSNIWSGNTFQHLCSGVNFWQQIEFLFSPNSFSRMKRMEADVPHFRTMHGTRSNYEFQFWNMTQQLVLWKTIWNYEETAMEFNFCYFSLKQTFFTHIRPTYFFSKRNPLIMHFMGGVGSASYME